MKGKMKEKCEKCSKPATRTKLTVINRHDCEEFFCENCFGEIKGINKSYCIRLFNCEENVGIELNCLTGSSMAVVFNNDSIKEIIKQLKRLSKK